MPFTVEDFRDLIRLLEERPEWRAELRRWVLSDELLTLPELVRSLTEAQRRTEERVGALEERVAALVEAQRRTEERAAALAEAQRRTEERVAALDDRMAALVEAQRRTEERVAALAEAQRRTEERVAALAEAQRRTEERVAALDDRVAALAEAQRRTQDQLDSLIGVVRTLILDVGELKGDALERRYRERAYAYFAPLLRRARVVAADELLARLERGMADGQLSEAEADQIIWADLVIQGRRRPDDTEVYLVVEASWQVDVEDVERAAERADLLGRTGLAAIPVVAGKMVTEAAARRARTLRVWQVTDGRMVAPER